MLSSVLAAQAKPIDNTELISRIDDLRNSCSKNIDSRLTAADHLMELIVLRIKKVDSAQYTIERNVWEAGDLLFRLTVSFQQNHLTKLQCITGTNMIKKKTSH